MTSSLVTSRHRRCRYYDEIYILRRSKCSVFLDQEGGGREQGEIERTGLHNERNGIVGDDERQGIGSKGARRRSLLLAQEGQSLALFARLGAQTVEKHKASLSPPFRPFRFIRRSNLPPSFHSSRGFPSPLSYYTATCVR